MRDQTNVLEPLLTLAEAAAFARVHAKTLGLQIRDGHLKAILIGRQTRIRRQDLMAYLRFRYIVGNDK